MSTCRFPPRYRVVGHIANGGMASVWKVQDELLRRLVAVKVLGTHLAAEPSSRLRFEREARTAARISSHPNVVTIHDVGEHDDVPFIVMELYAATIADRLRNAGPIAREEALTWLEQVGAGLDHAHREGIVHRDVKPANLLLDDHGRVAVGDFGIARLAEDTSVTSTGQVLGTAAYISPEQAIGQPATAASDRYSLAIVAFELLSGQRPFEGGHVVQARQHVESEPPPSGLGARADRVFRQAMAKQPDGRYPTAARFIEQLVEATAPLAEPATEQTRPLPRTAGAGPVRRARTAALRSPGRTPSVRAAPDDRRRWLVLIALVAVASIVVVIVLGRGDSAGPSPAASGDRTAASRPTTAAQDQAADTTDPERASSVDQRPTTAAREQTTKPQTDSAAPATSTANPVALNDAGFARLRAGDASGALPLLQQSVAAFEQQGDAANPLIYGYALYNLAEALVALGRPAEAIPYYERRLQVSPTDRRGLVEVHLADARAAVGQPGGRREKKAKSNRG